MMRDLTNEEIYELLMRADAGERLSDDDMESLGAVTPFSFWGDISILPHSIELLHELTILDVPFTHINELPHEIGKLKNLTYLNLTRTKISELPHEIGKLKNLTCLDLSSTPITELPHEIGKLTNLTKLDLWNTKITELPSEIFMLTNLTVLNLRGTHICKLPNEIGKLTKLTELDLFDTQISELPHEIGNLTKLTKLDLWNTKITELPSEIFMLTNLTVLNLHGTHICELPHEIGKLTKLTRLSLSVTPISELPHEIGKLTKLTELDLAGSQIYELPHEIGNLTKLTELDLSYTKLKFLPKEIMSLNLPFFDEIDPDENCINIHDTILTQQPISLFLQDRALIERYFAEEKTVIRESKVIFLGDGNAGKTHTLQRILQDGRDEGIHPESTPGIDLQRKQFISSSGQTVDIRFWDFGGQEILHAMHRCFLTERTLYVIVLRVRSASSGNDLTRQARFWLENVRNFAADSRVLLVVNREKNRTGRTAVNTYELMQEYPMLLGQPVEYCAVEDIDDNFSALTQKIVDTAAEMDSVGMEFPVSWYRVKERLAEKKASGKKPYVSIEYYREICDENGIEDEALQMWLLDWFNDLGECFSYHRQEIGEGESYQLLDPTWLTGAVYKIIRDCKADKDGSIAYETIRETLDLKSYEVRYILNIMRKFLLSYSVDEKHEFIPALIPSDMPDDFPVKGTPVLSYETEYRFLPDTVLYRLMVIYKDRNLLESAYRGGLRIRGNGVTCTISMRSDTNKLYIDLYTDEAGTIENNAAELLAGLRNSLSGINNDLRLTASERYVYTDGKHKAVIPLTLALNVFENDLGSTILREDTENETVLSIDVKQVLRGVYGERAIKKAERKIGKKAKKKPSGQDDTQKEADPISETLESEALPRVCWLQIGDLHIVDSAEENNLYPAILNSVREKTGLYGKGQGRIGLMIVGDLHNFWEGDAGGASRFLHDFVDITGADPKQDIFIVPGNHDTDKLDDNENGKRNEVITDGGSKPELSSDTVSTLEKPFDWYRKIVTEWGIYTEESAQDPAGVHVRKWRNHLQLLHLNTALLANGARDHSQKADALSVTSEEIEKAIRENRLPCLAMGHNSFHDLSEEQQNQLKGAFSRQKIRAYLCGDRHKPDAEQEQRIIHLSSTNPYHDANIPNIVGFKGAIDGTDTYSDAGIIWHVWDKKTNKVEMELLQWDRVNQDNLIPLQGGNWYPMGL